MLVSTSRKKKIDITPILEYLEEKSIEHNLSIDTGIYISTLKNITKQDQRHSEEFKIVNKVPNELPNIIFLFQTKLFRRQNIIDYNEVQKCMADSLKDLF